MGKHTAFLERYVSVWNEPEPGVRRARIIELWTPDVAHHTQTIRYLGYDELEERVTKAYEQWVGAGGYVFRSLDNAIAHHDMLIFNWEMLPAVGGPVVSVGFNIFLFAEDGRIRTEYQFNEPMAPSGPLNDRADAHVAAWNEADAAARADRLARLWTPDGIFTTPTAVANGRDEVAALLGEQRDDADANGLRLRSTRDATGQHDVVRFRWQLVRSGDDTTAGPTCLEILLLDGPAADASSAVRAAYRFLETPRQP